MFCCMFVSVFMLQACCVRVLSFSSLSLSLSHVFLSLTRTLLLLFVGMHACKVFAGERLGTVHGHCLECEGFAGERLGMSSSCHFCVLCLKIAEALCCVLRASACCVCLLRGGNVSMEKMKPCMQRCSMCGAYLETCACVAATTVVACMSCLCMSDMRAVNHSRWGCMSSAAAHVPFFRGQLCVAMLCRRRKSERGCRRIRGRFLNTARVCRSQGGLWLGPFSPLFPRALSRGTETRPSPVAFPAEDARRL